MQFFFAKLIVAAIIEFNKNPLSANRVIYHNSISIGYIKIINDQYVTKIKKNIISDVIARSDYIELVAVYDERKPGAHTFNKLYYYNAKICASCILAQVVYELHKPVRIVIHQDV